jgi:hypothetical protein
MLSWTLEAKVHVKFHENPLTGSSVNLGTEIQKNAMT